MTADFVDRVCDRLRAHWPAAACAGGVEVDAVVVRVRVVDALWLELRSPDAPTPEGLVPPWTVQPIAADHSGAWAVVSRGYGIGVRSDAAPDDVADRLYEEVRFWWAEYERIALATSG